MDGSVVGQNGSSIFINLKYVDKLEASGANSKYCLKNCQLSLDAKLRALRFQNLRLISLAESSKKY